MTGYEYYKAVEKLVLQKDKVKSLKRNTSILQKELLKFIELSITVRGHAWCMDVKSERHKMSKLVVDLINDVSLRKGVNTALSTYHCKN